MRAFFASIAVASVAAFLLPACTPEIGDAFGTSDEDVTGTPPRRTRAEIVRDTAAKRGLTNGVILAGIAQVESTFAQCWAEATWACKGPNSDFCNGGPVIAGAWDGPCDQQKGGLGMFQFDAGNFDQTLERDGREVLQLDGNVSHAVDFVSRIVREELKLKTDAEARTWMNGVKIANGDAKFEQLKSILACRYNGNCGGGRAAQGKKYGDATLAMIKEFGEAFWKDAAVAEPKPAVTPPPKDEGDTERPTDGAAGSSCSVRDDLRLYCGLAAEVELHAKPDPASEVVNVLRNVNETWFECWTTGAAVDGKTQWLRTLGDDTGQRGFVPVAELKAPANFDVSKTDLRKCR